MEMMTAKLIKWLSVDGPVIHSYRALSMACLGKECQMSGQDIQREAAETLGEDWAEWSKEHIKKIRHGVENASKNQEVIETVLTNLNRETLNGHIRNAKLWSKAEINYLARKLSGEVE